MALPFDVEAGLPEPAVSRANSADEVRPDRAFNSPLQEALIVAGFQPVLSDELLRFQAPLDQFSSPAKYLADLEMAIDQLRGEIRLSDLTDNEKLGALSAAKGARNHLGTYPSAIGFLDHCATRIADATRAEYSRQVESIPIAFAFQNQKISEVFTALANGTLYTRLLNPECSDLMKIDKSFRHQAKLSYIESALTDTNKPLHPISRSIATTLEALNQFDRSSVLIILPQGMTPEHTRLLTKELTLIRELRDPRKRCKLKLITYDNALLEYPPDKASGSSYTVVIHGSITSNFLREQELSQSRFPNSAVVAFKEPSNFDREALFDRPADSNRWHHGMDPAPKKGRRPF